jgi:hypothetical protein
MSNNAVAFIRLEEGNSQFQNFYMNMIQSSASHLQLNVKGFCVVSVTSDQEIDIFDTIQKQTFMTTDEYDVILIPSREVLSSDIFKQFEFVEECIEKNIAIRSITDLSNNLVDIIINEKNKTKNATVQLLSKSRDQMFKLAQEGVYLGGQVPFGYKLEKDKRLYIDENFREPVTEIFYQYSRGLELVNIGRLIWDIYKIGNSANATTEGNKKPYLKSIKLFSILLSPLYKGYPAYHKTKKVGAKTLYLPKEYWIMPENKIERLQIIEEELFEKVQERLIYEEWYDKLKLPNDLLQEYIDENKITYLDKIEKTS